MSIASWALANSSRATIGRAGRLGWRFIPRALSHSKVPQNTFANSKHRLGTGRLDITRKNSDSTQIPISPAGALAELVRDGEYDAADEVRAKLAELGVEIPLDHLYEGMVEHILDQSNSGLELEALVNWLVLLPDATAPNPPDSFRRIQDLMMVSPEDNIALIMRFGVICASKGYRELVEDHLTPVIERLASKSLYRQFLSDTRVAAICYRERIHSPSYLEKLEDPPEVVFETATADYSFIIAGAVPKPPSTLVLIESSLPKLLPETDVSGPIFEDELHSDYTAVSSQPSSASRHQPSVPTKTLARRVAKQKFEEAYRMLLEIEELGITIPPSRVYEKAAIAALRESSKHAPTPASHQDQLMQFTKWLSLIPPAHRSRRSRKFSELRRLIFLAPLTNMLLIIRFAVILASKGYADIISFQAVPLVMRFTSSDVSHQFLRDFEKANEEYWLSYKPSDASHMSRKTSTNARGTAVRGLAYSGRLSEALALLPVPGDGFRLTSYTYDILLRRLQELKIPEYQKHLQFVQELRGDESSTVHDKQEHADPMMLLADDLSMAAEFGTRPTEPSSHDLARILRSLKYSLVRAENLPHPFVILNFMDTYLTTTGRSRAITLLRSKAMRSSHRSTALFVFSEMLYYRRQGLHDEVIQTFVDHFYLTGIPRDDVLTRYQRIENLRDARAPADDKFPHVMTPIPRAWATRGKVWPSVAHCTLVWHSLVALTPDDRVLERLYAKLLQFASTKDTQPPVSLPPNEIGPLLTPPSWKAKVGSGAFTPFIRRLMYAFGASRGAALLGDMMRLGIQPTVYHFTELAGKYAKWGDAPRAFLILDRMEAGLLRGESRAASTVDTSASSPINEVPQPPLPPGQYNFPLPDIVMYIALIRGFIISKSLDAAEEAARRMKNHPLYSYVPGQDEYLDEIYIDLASLKRELGRETPESHGENH